MCVISGNLGQFPIASTSDRSRVSRDSTVLLVGRAGHLRAALLGLIKSLPNLRRVETTDNGLLALRLAQELHPQLVLIADCLQESEGPELVRQLRQNFAETHCLVLVDDEQQSEQNRLAGANCILPARVSSKQLVKAMAALL